MPKVDVIHLMLLFVSATSCYNLFEETANRILHRMGREAAGEILSVRRCIPKDQGRRMFGGSDPMKSYESNCDYILTLRYNDGKKERVKKDLIVPGRIPVVCGQPDPSYRAGMKVGLRIHSRLPGRVVVDAPEVRQRQTGPIAYCGWLLAALVCGAVTLRSFIAG